MSEEKTMRALLTKDAAGRIVILSTDDWWVAEQYEELKEETLDVLDDEVQQGVFYLWTGKSRLTYPCPLDGIGPDGSEFVRTEPLEVIDNSIEALPRFVELLFMAPDPGAELDPDTPTDLPPADGWTAELGGEGG